MNDNTYNDYFNSVEILKLCGFEEVRVLEQFVGKNLLIIYEDASEETICIKTMLMIYLYFMKMFSNNCHDIDTRVFLPFFCYIEENILPEVFDSAKRLKKMAEKGMVKHFESGFEISENWKLVILHLYVSLQVEVYEKKCHLIELSWFSNSCFVLLALLRNLDETKNKYLTMKMSTGCSTFGKSNIDILFHDRMEYWTHLCTFMQSGTGYRPLNVQTSLNIVFGNCLEVLVDNIYSLSDNLKDIYFETVEESQKILRKLVTEFRTCWNRFSNILIEDYNEVKEMDDYKIIDNQTSKNFGKSAHVVKYKILYTLSGALRKYAKTKVGQDDELNSRIFVIMQLKDFILENMKRTNSTTQTDIREAAITASVAIASFSSNKESFFERIEEYNMFVANIFEIWKSFLVSNDVSIRVSIISELLKYFENVGKCSDDLLDAIINSHKLNIENFTIYSMLLQNLEFCFKDINDMNKSLLERFRNLLKTLFNTIVASDYSTDLLYETGEPINILEDHLNNLISMFAVIDKLYLFIYNDSEQVESILLTIKEIAEKTRMYESGNKFTESMLFPSLLLILTRILRQTDRNVLAVIFERLNYYTFLTKFVSAIINEHTNNVHSKIISDLAVMIAYFCDTGLHIHCSFDEIQSEKEKKDFLYDFVYPAIIQSAILPIGFADRTLLAKCERSCWALGKIINNEIFRNGGERLISKFDGEMLQIFTIMKILLDKYESGTDTYLPQLLETVLFFIGKRMKLAPKLVEFILGKDHYLERETKNLVITRIFELLEYLLDKGYEIPIEVEDDWINMDIDREILPLNIRIMYQRVNQKFACIKLEDEFD